MSEKLVFDQEKWYTTSQVIDLAKDGYVPFKSLNTLYELIHQGKIKVVERGESKKKKYYIQGKELVKYAENQKVTLKANGKQMQKGSSKT